MLFSNFIVVYLSTVFKRDHSVLFVFTKEFYFPGKQLNGLDSFIVTFCFCVLCFQSSFCVSPRIVMGLGGNTNPACSNCSVAGLRANCF